MLDITLANSIEISGGGSASSFSGYFEFNNEGNWPPTLYNASGRDSEYWLRFTGQPFDTATVNLNELSSALAIYTDEARTNKIDGAIKSINEIDGATIKLELDYAALKNAGLPIGQAQLYLKYDDTYNGGVLKIAEDGSNVPTVEAQIGVYMPQPLAFNFANPGISDSESKIWLEFNNSNFTVDGVEDNEIGRETLKNSFVVSSSADFSNPISNAIDFVEFNSFNIELTLSDALLAAYNQSQNQFFIKLDRQITGSDGTTVPSINTQFYPSTSYFPSIPTGYEEEGSANFGDNGLEVWMFDGELADSYLKLMQLSKN